MRRSHPRRLLPLLLVALAAPAAAAERIVVLEFTGDASEKLRAAMTDRARAAALGPARKIGYDVMSRESTALVIEQVGAKCVEGQCELELARSVGAAILLTGEVRQLEGAYTCDLKLHDAEKGSLLALETARATDALTLSDRTPEVAERVLATGLERYFGRTVPALKRQELLRWYVGVQGYVPIGVDDAKITFTSGSSTDKQGRVGLRAGWRFRPSWAVELGGGYGGIAEADDPNSPSDVGPHTSVSLGWATAGVAWEPLANRVFSLAAEAGVAVTELEYVAQGSGPYRTSLASPTAGVEARVTYPIGRFDVGLRTGIRGIDHRGGVLVPAGYLHAGEEFLKGGTFFLWDVAASVGVSF